MDLKPLARIILTVNKLINPSNYQQPNKSALHHAPRISHTVVPANRKDYLNSINPTEYNNVIILTSNQTDGL